MQKIRLWDAPLRIFHWLLAGLVVAAFATGLTGGGLMDWHGRIGAAIAALLAFRLTWGFVGSTYARFTTFIRGPKTVAAYLRGEWQGIGHTPLGALSVLAMLGALLLQVLTGLLASDDIAFRGPYNVLVSANTESLAIFLHKNAIWWLCLLVALHLCAIAYYARIKGHSLVKPMITGIKEVPPDPEAGQTTRDAIGGGLAAVSLALALGALTGWAALGGPVAWLAPPLPVVESPGW